MTKIYAYLRVSKGDGSQNIDSQRHGLLEYANSHALVPVHFVEDTVTSRLDWRQRGNGKLITETAQAQDVILFPEATRAARNPLELLEMLKVAGERELKIVFIKENLTFNAAGQSEMEKMQTRHFVTMLGMAGELAREFTRLRTKEGIARARAEGKQIGRPSRPMETTKLDVLEKSIQKWVSQAIPISTIAKLCTVELQQDNPKASCGRDTVARWLKRKGIKHPGSRNKRAREKKKTER